ncbi:MAG: hypothetical protein K2Y27_07995 [Xanthobacteraceae bacterium]|nr:hypothetical protein [Xanthobacteraceae bacterium]
MSKKSVAKRPTTEELANWLRDLRLHQEGTAQPVAIPGFDAYAPSYLSDGATADHRQGGKENGELEQHPR